MDINNINSLNLANFNNNTTLDALTKFDNDKTDISTKFQESNEKLKEEIDRLLEDFNEKLKAVDKEITYSIHDKVNRYIITVKDRNTGEIIRECPPKKQLDIFARILENIGVLVDEVS